MKTKSKTIVFITGAFVSADCWDQWKIFFEDQGYKTIVPSWPHKNEPACTLRQRHPDAAIASQRLAGLTDYYDEIVRQLPEKPILIGHSMGGLITQLLLQRGIAEAGIAIHSLQPKGVMTFKFSFYKAGWGPLGFFTNTKKSYLMSFTEWQYAFTNGMGYEEQKKAYYDLLTPESKLVVRDAITNAAKIDFSRPHAPLLFLAGGKDNFIPASLNLSNFNHYQDEASVTAFKQFEDANHFVLGQPGWEEKAGYILNWLKTL
ncbi:Pimeloyl-ACP methyl ester carboxylesterase [Mucilaginibacter pineti]|uniref:Pimeloyl-ACP methyl ester carboxylesterase n=1 Tax=Mucilaginibacter pineti TaxID=1391627 RepID=A0A1G6ZHG3_9SPHI|nr:alpha/beta hydrolase [Mucilaginibacter pineti]SDE02144.1 Pimeloyl-ACP methyl ester carboxylesterase [Mucilaginibacter pineti]